MFNKQLLAPTGVVLALAAAVAIAAFLGAQEAVRPGLLLKAFAQANEQTGTEMTVLPVSETTIVMPEVYAHIRPAGVNGEPQRSGRHSRDDSAGSIEPAAARGRLPIPTRATYSSALTSAPRQ